MRCEMKIWNWLLNYYIIFVSFTAGIGFYLIAEGVKHRYSRYADIPTWRFNPLLIGIGAGLLVFSYIYFRTATNKK